jgi:dTDP-4-amino-4,6-dideoxygalactose transaminase
VDAKIPFNRISQAGGEMAFVAEAIANAHASGNGPFTHRCEAVLELATDVRRVLLTTSCTHALEMSGLLLDVGSGDEVIVPSFTFVSTVNAFVLRGAKPVFVDVRPDTLNMDERLLEGLITSRTRVIVPVHYAGVGCEMDSILAVAGRRSIAVVEDNAHGLFGKYKGKPLGSFGCLATQSFHETKNISCGEGGALVINDSRYVERAEIIREKGTDRSKFFRGQVDKYTWVDIGSSYVMSDLLAAFLYAQLEQRDAIQARRRAVWERYHEGLADWAAAHGVRTPVVPAHCEQAYHMYYLVMPDSRDRDALLAHLKKQGVHAVFHYLPLHTSPMGRRFGGREGQCPVTERVSARLLRLPFYAGLSEEEQATVIRAVQEWPG